MNTETLLQTTDQKQEDTTQNLVNARKETLKKQRPTRDNGGFTWLNEHSRKFLASGYLTEGATPEGRIWYRR